MPQIGMHISDVVVWLKESHGLNIPRHRILYAIRTGSVTRPYTTASGDYGWAESDLPSVAAYFRDPKKPGRPKRK